ncbi:MAG: glutamyl-tRNA(Gln) amidotransferase subunit C [marine bacterium B5-7]|nr:MAG: glutamyl-tRNA(Gln) amidotransferase subunit C [marine bacterium B5-7]
MSISNQDVHHIARLARLGISDEEVEIYADNLSRILDLVAQMNDVDTDGIEPMAHPSDVSLRLRDDTVSETDHRDEFMGIAPASENGLYLVPKVIE